LTFSSLARDVRTQLAGEHRYRHVVRVARLAGKLAATHGVAPQRARLAGMLHDLARLYSAERLVRECEQRGLAIDAFERRNPIVLHARLGAELARERFGVADEDVLGAIRAHTLGAPAMSPLEEIVYLADALEPGRSFEGRAELERLAFENVPAAMLAVLESSATYLSGRGLEVAPQTLAAIERYRGLPAAKGAATCLI
jgi:predicted HD superfamily hydrolase involved in NAD metabolism